MGKIGKFQILGTLGTGAHSTILHVRRQADATQYALKVVPINGPEDAKYVEQARHEFRVAQKLSHPALVKIYQLETVRDWLFRARKLYLLLEYVNGRTLDTFKAFPIPKMLQIFERVAAGLEHMHRKGVFHADLKPNNILLSRSGEVKVIDYGLAWVKGEPKGRVQGTPEFMAPETAKNRLVNERTDIYNLGATMYRLVTFRLPASPMIPGGEVSVGGRTWEKLVKPVAECNAQAPPELCDLIHRCLSFDAHKRPQDMGEIRRVLQNLLGRTAESASDRPETLEWEEA